MLQDKPSALPLASKPAQKGNNFMDLPPEMHLHIISHLSYPDALALKHTNSYFYSLVTTNVQFRVNWIIERVSSGLPILWRKCELRTDESFCKGDVKRTMERRRRHKECKPGDGGCAVVAGSNCGGGSSELYWQFRRCKVLMRRATKIALEHQMLAIGLLLCIIAVLWQILF
ncbi:hypothetical protein DIZ76_017269 [Coccidioides immitis]|nr:hypothetical protein DIZ76_017269 [Coccidioides immitis]